MKKMYLIKLSFLVLCIGLSFISSQAQTSGFTYQGKLTDGMAAANGQYDLTFRLFSIESGGMTIAPDNVLDDVPVTNGIFTVNLDFGADIFIIGGFRYLEIAVRTGASTGTYTNLAPRQEIRPAPYSLRSIFSAASFNSSNLGGIAADQYVLTFDPRLFDARNPLPNSANYIQNGTGVQADSNFNISGNGTVGGTLSGGTVNAATQYNLGGIRAFFISGLSNTNTVVGELAGQQNPTGGFNSFFGNGVGRSTTLGGNNSFFGSGSGSNNVNGSDNSFFGRNAGFTNSAGNNSFFGSFSGAATTSGTGNSFFGKDSGISNQTGSSNAYVGFEAGIASVSGSFNTYIGRSSGRNSIGGSNTFVGSFAGENFGSGIFNVLLGSNAGRNFGSGSNNTIIGGEAIVTANMSNVTALGYRTVTIGSNLSNATAIGADATVSGDNLSYATAIGAGALVSTSNTIVLGRSSDNVVVAGLGVSGSTPLCRNASNQIAFCSSSLRYKTNIAPFSFGLSVINQLRPISFDWKDGGIKDVGFGAEEVAKFNPLFVTYNDKGEVEGIKYDRLSVVFVNAFKEQQTQIEKQQQQIDELKRIVCSLKPDAEICQ